MSGTRCHFLIGSLSGRHRECTMLNDPDIQLLSRPNHRLFADQVEKQFQQIGIGTTATLINGFILVLVVRDYVPIENTVIWVTCALISSGLRLGLLWTYRRSTSRYTEPEKWNSLFIATLFFAGFVWGLAAILLFPSDSIGHQAFVAFVTGGMVAGAVGSFTAVMTSFLVFSLPALLPICIRFFLLGGNQYAAMGGMTLLFLVMMVLVAARMHKDILNLLTLKYERTILIADLKLEIDQRKAAQEELHRQNEQVEETVTQRTIQLAKSEEKYRVLVENISDIIFAVDQQGIITYISPVVESILDYGVQEMMGTCLFDYVYQEDRLRLQDDFAGATEVIDGQYEYRFYGKTGKLKWFRASSSPIFQDRERIGTQGVLVDITLSKTLAEQIQRAQKMEALEILAGGVAHDLNNILSGLVSYPELLLLDLPEDSPLRQPLQVIKQSGKNAAAVVQDLMSLTRHGMPMIELLNVNHIVKRCLDLPENQARLRLHPNIQVTTSLQIDLLNIYGSSHLLIKILSNLIANAIDAMPGRIEITAENCYADRFMSRFDAVVEGEYVVLAIADTGIGIPEKDRARIFEPFYTRRVMGRSGSGLGLAVVWGMVKDHNGYIDLQSEDGHGTRFELFFPATREQLLKEEQQEELSDLTGNNQFILVVDDIPAQREIATGILNRLGYTCDAVASGEEAIEYIQKYPVDLMVLDMIMEPGINGCETFRRIKTFRPDQRAIIASGYSETELLQKVRELGVGGYIKKPYTIEAFGKVVKKLLQN